MADNDKYKLCNINNYSDTNATFIDAFNSGPWTVEPNRGMQLFITDWLPEPYTVSITTSRGTKKYIVTKGTVFNILQDKSISTTAVEITQEPVITTQAPVITTQAPVITTQAPEMTTQAPVMTTQAPVTTTQAPEMTTRAPEMTTLPTPAPESSNKMLLIILSILIPLCIGILVFIVILKKKKKIPSLSAFGKRIKKIIKI
jgi:hypothetical protein